MKIKRRVWVGGMDLFCLMCVVCGCEFEYEYECEVRGADVCALGVTDDQSGGGTRCGMKFASLLWN